VRACLPITNVVPPPKSGVCQAPLAPTAMRGSDRVAALDSSRDIPRGYAWYL